jgi:hypothetical protein
MKIKPQKGGVGTKISPTPDNFPKSEYNYPIFCLKHIHRDFCIANCTEEEKGRLIDRMHKLSSMTWEQVRQAPRHGLGQEIISQDAIKAGKPPHVTPDMNLYALRFDGLKPFVGYKKDFIFHILYIDRDFTLYKHG